jgi:predicted RNase H-like HicB family nuclease
MRFVLGGVERELDAETVRKVAEQHAPNPIDGRHKYYVDIGGLRYPVNQLFGLATGMRPDEFITDDANRLLSKLGFVIEKFRRPTALPIQAKGIDSQQSYRERESENSVSFAVSLEPDEDGFIVASCPQLPGCHSQGRSRQEAVKNIEEAIRGYIASMKSHEEEIPRVDWDLVRVSV